MNKPLFFGIEMDELLASFRQIVREELTKLNNESSQTGDNELILDLKQTALFLGLAEPTVYSLTSKNLIPHFKKRKRLYFKKLDLLKWIETGKVPTRDEQTKEAFRKLEKNRPP